MVNIRNLFLRKSSLHYIQRLYRKRIVDLGGINDQFRGVFSPGYDSSSVNHYLTRQFREDAQSYVHNYQKFDYFENLLSIAFAKIGLHQEQRTQLTILDICSGAGNSVFPRLNLCPQSLVIASDLSVELLVLLKNFLQQKCLHGNCLLLQLNAEELDFTERTFDLVVGAAALHHLFAPEKTIEGCAKILKKGGYAIFFEPFENGHALLNLAYRDILREEQSHSLPEESRNFLLSRIGEYDLRKGRDKTRLELSSVDDKWLFTRQYFWEMAERYGFVDCTIYPLYPLDLAARQFTLQTEINLGLTFGTERELLPKWAWQIIEKYDNAFSEDFKKESLLEGTVILRK